MTDGVGVPVADVVQPVPVPLSYFSLFGAAVGVIVRPAALVGQAWTGRFDDVDVGRFEPGEKLTAGFSLPRQPLPVRREVLQHLIAKHKRLTGISDRVVQHSFHLSERHTEQSGFCVQGKPSVKPPSA